MKDKSQTPNVVRVAPGTVYHRVGGNRRASRNGRVSDPPPETPNDHDSPLVSSLYLQLRVGYGGRRFRARVRAVVGGRGQAAPRRLAVELEDHSCGGCAPCWKFSASKPAMSATIQALLVIPLSYACAGQLLSGIAQPTGGLRCATALQKLRIEWILWCEIAHVAVTGRSPISLYMMVGPYLVLSVHRGSLGFVHRPRTLLSRRAQP
jgi:hypothetical protein